LTDSNLDIAKINHLLMPVRGRFKNAMRKFLLIGFGSAIFASIVVWFLSFLSPILLLGIWVLIAGAGASLGHQSLERVSREVREIVEPTMMSAFSLVPAEECEDQQFAMAFNQLGLFAYGEYLDTTLAYESSDKRGLQLQELEVTRLVYDAALRRMKYRVVFVGQTLQGFVDQYDGEPFLLIPRSFEIESLRVGERNAFLGEDFDRKTKTDREMSKHFQVWGRKQFGGEVVSETIRKGIIEAAEMFPRNQISIGVTSDESCRLILRMSVDLGALYARESSANAPIDDAVIQKFQKKLSKLLLCYDLIREAVMSGQSQNSNVPTTGT